MPERRPETQKAENPLKALFFKTGLPLGLLCAAIYGGYLWLFSEVGGEYYGMSKELGAVQMSLDKQGSTLSGNMQIRGEPTMEIDSGIVDGNKVELSFAVNDRNNKNALFNKATFVGESDTDVLRGTLTKGKYDIAIKLKRTPASVMFRRLWWQR